MASIKRAYEHSVLDCEETYRTISKLKEELKIKEEARDESTKRFEFLSALNKKLEIDNMSLRGNLLSTKEDLEHQLKIKEDIVQTMNKSFTEKVKSMKNKIDALELLKERKIKEEEAEIRKEKKLEKKVKQKTKKQEAELPSSTIQLDNEAIDDDPKFYSTIPTNNKFEALNNNNVDNIDTKSELETSSDFLATDFQLDKINESETPIIVSNLLSFRRSVKCELCDEMFNWQDTIGQALHKNKHRNQLKNLM